MRNIFDLFMKHIMRDSNYVPIIESGSRELFAIIMQNLIENSNFIPIIVEEYAPMLRLFLINLDDIYCMKKFLRIE